MTDKRDEVIDLAWVARLEADWNRERDQRLQLEQAVAALLNPTTGVAAMAAGIEQVLAEYRAELPTAQLDEDWLRDIALQLRAFHEAVRPEPQLADAAS